MYILIISLSIAYLTYIWLNTDFFIEYVSLLKLNKYNLFYSQDYFEYINPKNIALETDRINLSYLQFIQRTHNNFFVRLISCPLCLSLWMSLFFAWITLSFLTFLATAYLGSFFYYLLKSIIIFSSYKYSTSITK